MDKAQWAKSTTGPDLTDAESLMRAIGALHSGHVALTFSPDGTGFNGGVVVTAGVIFERLPGSQLPGGVTVDARWPNNTQATFWACVFNLLYQLDYQISKVYQNESLWK